MDKKDFKRTLVTAALPYANGPVHIGHLAGVYVPADIYVRYKRLQGENVLFVGGSDEHGVPVTIRARKEGCSVQDIVDRYHNLIKTSFERFGISFDVYSRTTSKIHHQFASDFFKYLNDHGKFIQQESEQFYDEATQEFLTDRNIKGECPVCHAADANGDQCEKCGSTLSPDELINPVNAINGNPLVKRKTTHWYLPLNEYQPWLEEWILKEHKEWRPNVYGQCKSWLDADLRPRAVTRDLNWGIPVPVEGAEGKVLYVWFDAPIGYISNTKELCDAHPEYGNWETWWKDDSTRLIHFIGKDNIVFHCIVFPTMLKAHGGYILPDNVPSNEFLNLEGEKISTSRNWAIWLNEYLDEFPGKQDVLRYVLTANAGELTDYDRATIAEFKGVKETLSNNIEQFHFREALKDAMNLARIGNKYLADTEPWKLAKTDMKRVETIMNVSLQICANLAIAFEPFLPFTAEKLRAMLGMAEVDWNKLGQLDILADGAKIEKPVLLFEKIEDSVIQAQLDKLARIKQENIIANFKPEPVAKECTFDDFMKLDIRVGKVLECSKVKKADKLLQFKIDDGMGGRTIVSGIAKFYEPADLIGKEVCFIANFPPRKLKGIESQGMILSAEDADGRLVVIGPQGEVKPGVKVG